MAWTNDRADGIGDPPLLRAPARRALRLGALILHWHVYPYSISTISTVNVSASTRINIHAGTLAQPKACAHEKLGTCTRAGRPETIRDIRLRSRVLYNLHHRHRTSHVYPKNHPPHASPRHPIPASVTCVSICIRQARCQSVQRRRPQGASCAC